MAECAAEIRLLGASDVAMMDGLLRMFGEAFGEPDAYGGNPPGPDYLRRLLGGDSFIALPRSHTGGMGSRRR